MTIYSIWANKIGGLHLGYLEAESRKSAVAIAQTLGLGYKRIAASSRPFDRAHVDFCNATAKDMPLQRMLN